MKDDYVDSDSFPKALVKVVPELEHVFVEHMEYYDEVLPHVFLGDLTRYLLETYRLSQTSGTEAHKHLDVLKRTLAFLEDGLKSAYEDVAELVAASFLEMLRGKVDDGFRMLLGPESRRRLARQEN